MTGSSAIRASDSDREQVADRLRHATAEGRLTADELEERLEALYRSRTYGEIDVLVADLPVPRSPRAVSRTFPWWLGAAGAGVVVLAVLGMLAGAATHSREVFVPRRSPPSLFVTPGPDPRHLVIGAATRLAVFGLVAACALLALAFVRLRNARRG